MADTFWAYGNLRDRFQAIRRQCERFSPVFRDGSAKATLLFDGVASNAFDRWSVELLIFWDLTDPNTDVAAKDYGVSAETLARWKIDPAALQDSMTERDRTKLLNFFRADKSNAQLDVTRGLVAVRDAMNAAQREAETLLALQDGADVNTIKRVRRSDGTWAQEGKTLTEMGVDATTLANLLDDLKAKIDVVVA